MNEIYRMELKYESLIPIDRPKDTFLSVGTVTFLIEGKELPLDFNITEGGTEGNAGSIISVNALIKNFEPLVFMKEYRELGLHHQHLTMISLQTTILTPIWRKYTRNTFIQIFQKRFICRLP